MELYYLDIHIGSVQAAEPESTKPLSYQRSDADDIPVAVVSSRAVRVLHGGFTRWRYESGSQPYALALPQGLAVLRVFCARRDDLDELADRTEKHPFMRDYAIYGRIRRAPITEQTRWVEYRRYRIPNLNAIAVSGHENENIVRRDTRIKHARKLPHFVILSKSTGKLARIFVEQENWSGEIPQGLTPDSWGLSRLSAPFAVPAF